MFRGFKGYIQADAHCVYDELFGGDTRIDETDKPPDEVACWSHARRKVWEFFAWPRESSGACSASAAPLPLPSAMPSDSATLRRFLDDGRLRMENNASERVLPYWPRGRYLELAPQYRTRTHALLEEAELKRQIGHVTLPPLAAEQQPPTN